MRDIKLEDTIYPRFTTRAFATGIPTVLAGTPVLSIYEENNLTQITSGVSVSVDYDSVVGLNQATIVATAANGYEAGKSYDLVITTGTVGGVSVVGEVVGSFSIQSAPVNWARVTAPTTAVDLSATDIQLVDTTTTNTDMRGTDSALLAASINLTAGAVDNVTTVATTTTNTDMRGTDSALLAASINLTGGAVDTVTTVGTTTTNTDMRGTDSALLAASINLTAGAVDNVTTVATTTTNTDMRGTDSAYTGGNITGNLSGSVGSVTGNIGGNVTGSVGSNLELGPAEVNAEVVDVMKTDTISEMAQQAPPTTPTFEEAVMYLYMALVHKGDVTATLKEFHNNAGTVIWKKTLSDDGTTYSEADGATGP